MVQVVGNCDRPYRVHTRELLKAPQVDPSAQLWRNGIYANLVICFLDRIGGIVMPYEMELYPPHKMPELGGTHQTYEQCCDARAAELLAMANKMDIPLGVLWSGGVDSTVVLTSLMKALPREKWRERLHVYLNYASIKEYPSFYRDFIRPYCTFLDASTIFHTLTDGRVVAVTGELNDQLHGSDVIGKMENSFPGYVGELLKPYSYSVMVGMFQKVGMSRHGAEAWYAIHLENAKRAPCDIKTSFDLLWWFAFVFEWQEAAFMTYMKLNRFSINSFSEKFFTKHCHNFFSTTEFQKWSVNNPHLKIGTTWESYKFHAKELIHKFAGDEDYLKHKRKEPSLLVLEKQRRSPFVALGADFKFYGKVDWDAIYHKDHFFKPQQVVL